MVALRSDHVSDSLFQVVIHLAAAVNWARDDERGSRLVDQNRIDLINHGKIVASLDLLILMHGHGVVSEIVESEFRSSSIDDVASLHFFALVWMDVIRKRGDG